MTQITASALRRAADLKDKIEELEGELASLLGRESNGLAAAAEVAKPDGRKTGRRQMSAAGRARIAAAARLRWKKAKASGKNSL